MALYGQTRDNIFGSFSFHIRQLEEASRNPILNSDTRMAYRNALERVESLLGSVRSELTAMEKSVLETITRR